jgi:NTE family protein
MEETVKTVCLVLGSGGARGLTHIGIIRWLEENGYRIVSVSGSSMGALVGGIYAAGKLDEFEKWVRSITKFDIFSLIDLSFSKKGFVKGDKIINVLRNLVGDRRIQDLPIRFTAVAADIEREKEVWINKGSLFDAIRASISIPFFFTPVMHNGATLIDGGVLNPVPIAPTFHDRADVTIAVNLNGTPERDYEETAIQETEEKELSPFREKIRAFVDGLRGSRAENDDDDWDMQYIASQSIDAMQGAIARHKLAAYPPDVVVDIARNTCGTFEFDRADEMIALGYRKAGEKLGDLENRLIRDSRQ